MASLNEKRNNDKDFEASKNRNRYFEKTLIILLIILPKVML